MYGPPPRCKQTEDSPDLQAAVTGAAHKMQRLLESTFGRIEAKRLS
jgi:hypothetical protein